jgi:dCTP deaminase
VIHATAGFIDPGFEGQITLELSNLGRIPVRLYPGMRIAQIVLHQLTSAVERPYGASRGSHYHGQTGPQASRIELD